MNPLLVVAAVLVGKMFADAKRGASSEEVSAADSPSPEQSQSGGAARSARAYRDPPSPDVDPAEPEAPQLSTTGQSADEPELSTGGQSDSTDPADEPELASEEQNAEPTD